MSGNPGQRDGNPDKSLPDGKTDRMPWQMSATPASARSIRARPCSSMHWRRRDARRCSRIAPPARAPIAPDCAPALDYVREGDVLMVWKLDRLGRSLPHLIETVAALATRGVGFRSITEAIDTTTPGGRLVFHLFAALGQFERDLIQERTRAGLAAAAARGRKGGRKPVVTSEKLEARPNHHRQRADRPRGRNPAQSWQDRALYRATQLKFDRGARPFR